MRRGKKGLNDFKFGTFIGRFPSDGTVSVAVKGLISLNIGPNLGGAVNKSMS